MGSTNNSKGTILKKVRKETILKIYNTLVLPTFLYGSENWTLTALQRRRIEAAEMKLLRPLTGYTLYDHETNDYIRRELQITGILDKIDEYRGNYSSEISPTRCNNCVFILRNGFTLHVSGENLTHHQEYICCIWPQLSRLT